MSTKVLIFESDAPFAEELKNGFSGLGCAATVVDDANLGLQTAARERPDLILLAIELPRMNGFSVCNKLKRDAALKDVPLIIMSSESSEETFEQHRRLRTRAEDYVHKPVSFNDMLLRARNFVPAMPVGVEPEPESASEVVEDEVVIDDELDLEEIPASVAPTNGASVGPRPSDEPEPPTQALPAVDLDAL